MTTRVPNKVMECDVGKCECQRALVNGALRAQANKCDVGKCECQRALVNGALRAQANKCDVGMSVMNATARRER